MAGVDRYPPIGLFNFAASYQAAAELLLHRAIRATHPEAPIAFLYYHSIELYLKAYLRLHNVSMRRLRDIGHDFIKLGVRAQHFGLLLNARDLEILQILSEGDAWARARYLELGMASSPDLMELGRTCKRLNKSIGQAMSSAGLPVRVPRSRKAQR